MLSVSPYSNKFIKNVQRTKENEILNQENYKKMNSSLFIIINIIF